MPQVVPIPQDVTVGFDPPQQSASPAPAGQPASGAGIVPIPSDVTVGYGEQKPMANATPALPEGQTPVGAALGTEPIKTSDIPAPTKEGKLSVTHLPMDWSGLKGIGSDLMAAAKGAVSGAVDMAKGPKDDTENKIQGIGGPAALPIYRALLAAGHTIKEATEIVGAVKDIGQSDDPLGTFAKVLQKTSSQGAAQATLALATEGVLKAAPKVVDLAGDASAAVYKRMGKVVDPASLTESLHKGIRNQITRAIDVKKEELATNPALPKTPPTAESMVDAHPVKMEYSPHGDVLDLDGRHRVMQAIERGDERINLQLTARDGGISNISVDPKYVAEKFGVTKESLAGTDAAQPYRAENLQPRPAEMMPASKDAAKLQADAESAAAKPVKNGSADLIEKAEPAASTSPQSTSMRKIGDNASQDFHNLASSDYKVIDDASRGDLKELQNRIENNKRELRRLTDSEEDAKKAASIELRQKDTEQAIEDIFDDLDKKGIDHAVIQRARNSHKAAMAADEFSTRMKRSGVVEGANPDSTGPLAKELNKSNPETVNPSAYHKRVIEPLFNSGRLQDFVGPKIAEEMFDHSLEHAAAYDKIMRNRANAIGLARTVGRSALQTMGLGGLGYGVYHLTREH